MRAPTMLRKKGTAHYAAVPVGARIARLRFVQHSLFTIGRQEKIRTHFRFGKLGSDYIGLVPVAGVEPARPCGHGILNPGRLPIPPHRHGE